MTAQFLIEFLSILSWRLSFLAGELPSNPQFLKGGGGRVTMFANQKSLKHMQSKFQRETARTPRNFYDLRVPISLLGLVDHKNCGACMIHHAQHLLYVYQVS